MHYCLIKSPHILLKMDHAQGSSTGVSIRHRPVATNIEMGHEATQQPKVSQITKMNDLQKF